MPGHAINAAPCCLAPCSRPRARRHIQSRAPDAAASLATLGDVRRVVLARLARMLVEGQLLPFSELFLRPLTDAPAAAPATSAHAATAPYAAGGGGDGGSGFSAAPMGLGSGDGAGYLNPGGAGPGQRPVHEWLVALKQLGLNPDKVRALRSSGRLRPARRLLPGSARCSLPAVQPWGSGWPCC